MEEQLILIFKKLGTDSQYEEYGKYLSKFIHVTYIARRQGYPPVIKKNSLRCKETPENEFAQNYGNESADEKGKY